MTFRDIVSGAGSKVDVVVSFLAMLELVKQRTVRAAQADAFADITIARID
jgi:segregation and condensation protein A